MKIGRVLAALPMLVVSHAAWAQEVQVQVGVQPPPPPPRVVVVAQPPPPPPPYYGPPPRMMIERPLFPRFRWGLSFEGGPYFFNGSTGGEGAVSVRAGVQVNELFGVYAQPVAILGGGASVNGTGSSASALLVGGVGVLAELDLGNIFYVAGGPEVLGGAAGSGDSAGNATAAEGVFFGVTARLGLELGTIRPHRRAAFQLGGDLHVIFTPGGAVVTPMISLGYDMF